MNGGLDLWEAGTWYPTKADWFHKPLYLNCFIKLNWWVNLCIEQMCIKVMVEIYTIIVFCSEISFFTCVHLTFNTKIMYARNFNVIYLQQITCWKLQSVDLWKKSCLPQLCAKQLLVFGNNIFQCAVYRGLWLLMSVESCDKIVQSVISERVADVITSLHC